MEAALMLVLIPITIGVVAALVSAEAGAWLWHLSNSVARKAGLLMPTELRDPYCDELLGELNELRERPLAAVVVSVRMYTRTPSVAHEFFGVGLHTAPVLKRSIKRAIDMVLGISLVTAVVPAMAVLALAVKLTSRGSAFVALPRIGRDGKTIMLRKFRTLKAKGASESAGELTGVGGFLRKWSLDELPFLWSVVSGSMSLIGPRPRHPSHVDQSTPATVLGVRPGITGAWQVVRYSGGTNDLAALQSRVDDMYVRDWSLLLDVRILLRTMTALFWRQRKAP